MRILIVEDDKDLCLGIQFHLEHAGYTTMNKLLMYFMTRFIFSPSFYNFFQIYSTK